MTWSPAFHLEGIVRPIERVTIGVDAAPQDRPRQAEAVCEELGPTFVKLGQVLSTRPDIIPEAYTIELAALRDDVRPFPFIQVEKILTEDYHAPLAEVFLSLDPQPVASASISQVHREVLRDGRTVALKIRRPDITKVVQADLDILKNLVSSLPSGGFPSWLRTSPWHWPGSSSAASNASSTSRSSAAPCSGARASLPAFPRHTFRTPSRPFPRPA